MRCVKCGNELHNSKCSRCGFEHRGATVCFLTEPKAEDIRLMGDFSADWKKMHPEPATKLGDKLRVEQDRSVFEIRDGVLLKYHGTAADVVIPEGIHKIGWYAFRSNKRICSVAIPQGVKIIGEGAFFNCENLKYVSFPDTLKIIRELAFSNTGLQKVVLPEHLRSLGLSAFSGSKIEKIVIPCSIKEMSGAFYGCKQLREIEFREGIRKIGSDSFRDCTALRSVKFPEGLEYIDTGAFSDCDRLEHIVLPDTVALPTFSKTDFPFYGCDNLKNVVVSKKWVRQHPKEAGVFGKRLWVKVWS